MQNCLKQGIGYTICPAVSVQEELKKGRLTELSLAPDPIETSVIMIWHVDKWCSPLLRRFMGICERIISD